ESYGAKPPRTGPYPLVWFHSRGSNRGEGSSFLFTSLQRRSTLGQVAANKWPIRSCSGSLIRQRRGKPRPKPAGHYVAVEWHHQPWRSHASSDSSWRWNGFVALYHRARHTTASAADPGLPGRHQCSFATRVRL